MPTNPIQASISSSAPYHSLPTLRLAMSTATPDPTTPSPASSKVRKFKHDFAATNNNVPALPDEVERGLLQVGMRVRAAMGQGYRTYHDRNAGLLHSNLGPLTGSANWQRPFGNNLADLRGSGDAAAAPGPSGLASTQASAATDVSAHEPVSSPGRKRALDLAEDQSAGAAVPPAEDSMDTATTQLRSIAQPKTRKRTFGRVQTAPARFESEPDFDEADFLSPENWSDAKAADGTGL